MSRFSIRCACSGFFGSPNVFIFLIAAASSGFWRSSAAIDAFWNHRLKSGTFERNGHDGPQVPPAADPPEQHEGAQQEDEHEDDERAGSRPRTAWRDA